ncbi:hypothetical protein Tco_0544825 [Tanacetum coccineum]
MEERCRSPILWGEVGKVSLKGTLSLVQETNEGTRRLRIDIMARVIVIKIKLDKRSKPLEFSVGDYVLCSKCLHLKMVRFGKKRKLAPRLVWKAFEITKASRPCRPQPTG